MPSFWLLWRAYSSRRAWWLTWVHTEFKGHYDVYICLTVVAVTAFAIVGYLIGLQNDRWIDEAQTARESNLELSHQAATDPLTGLFNGRAINERLDVELEDAYRSPLSCLLIDLDHFKRINDNYGHPFGDSVLIAVSKILKKTVRRIDAVGRLGGEEFIILLPGISKNQAEVIGDRVRAAVEEEHMLFGDKRVRITVSLGVATYQGGNFSGKRALLKAADDALYQAKRLGRNRVVLWKESELVGEEEDADAA